MSTAIATKTETALFTIGYEGRTISEYISLLEQENISAVVDVRKNPISRKKGFSKTALSNALHEAGISYHHIRGLGIDSSLRRNLSTPQDYEDLLRMYETEILPSHEDAIAELFSVIEEKEAVALTCFERDPAFCHRRKVAEAVEKKICHGNGIKAHHIS